MNNVNLTPLTKLTVDDVKKLTIHSTRSSIRRAAAVKQMVTVPATDEVPTLYYIKEVHPKTKEISWSIHALSAEVSKFLLMQSI